MMQHTQHYVTQEYNTIHSIIEISKRERPTCHKMSAAFYDMVYSADHRGFRNRVVNNMTIIP